MTLLTHTTITAIGCVVWTTVGFVWVIGRFTAKRTAVSQPWTTAVPYYGLLTMSLLMLLDIVPLPDARLMRNCPELSGLTLIIVGACIALWARAVLARNWSGAVALQGDHELIVRGPYRFVRHPIYSGFLLMVLGTALAQGRAQAFAAVIILIGCHVWKLRAEEVLLARHFPHFYPDYKARTKALIPFIL